jgi:DNA topoisomerase-2
MHNYSNGRRFSKIAGHGRNWIIGRDKFGCFPLRGKFLNVREAATKQIGENPEIQNLCKIIGLQIGKKYEDISSLRYGSIMIMTD